MKTAIKLFLLSCTLYSCHSASYTHKRSVKAQEKLIIKDSNLLSNQIQGIDFVGMGDYPSPWKLTMDFDKEFVFTSSNSNKLRLQPVLPSTISDASEDYTLIKDNQPVLITLFKNGCDHLESNQSISKKTTVKIADVVYTGCGQFLYDYRINEKWTLDYINNEKQQASNFIKGLPSIQLNIAKEKMIGNDGSNEVSASIEVRGNRIKFSSFQVGNKNVSINNQVTKIFEKLLSNQLVEYRLNDNLLFFYLIDDSKLVFKRVE